jgi:hypothetical protein
MPTIGAKTSQEVAIHNHTQQARFISFYFLRLIKPGQSSSSLPVGAYPSDLFAGDPQTSVTVQQP